MGPSLFMALIVSIAIDVLMALAPAPREVILALVVIQCAMLPVIILWGWMVPLNKLAVLDPPPAQSGTSLSGRRSTVWPIAFSLAGLAWLAAWGYSIHLNDRPWKIMTDIVGFGVFQLVALAWAIRLWRKPVGKLVAVASAILALGAIAFGSFVYLEGYKTVPLCPIGGLVIDAVTGEPIAGARVSDHVYGGGPSRPIRETWTDSDGHFMLRTWFEEHTLSASSPGYETRLKLFSGSEPIINFNFELQPTAAPTKPVWREALIPDADAKGVPVILDLASGQMLAPPEGKGNEAFYYFTRLGQGDVGFDLDSVIFILRAGKLVTPDGKTLEPKEVKADASAYDLATLSEEVVVKTADGRAFRLKVLTVTSEGGLRIRYAPAAAPG